MQLYDMEERLVAIDSKATRGFVWTESKEWGEIAADFASKVWLEGRKLSESEAKRRFEGVKLDEIPPLD